MSNVKYIILIVVVLIVIGAIINLTSSPAKAEYNDNVSVDIGGDGVLNATVKHALKTGENDIADGSFKSTVAGDISWFNAKNISYVDNYGNKDYMIVWKTTPDNYDFFTNSTANEYYSGSAQGSVNGVAFVLFSKSDNMVYGIIMDCSNINYTESNLVHDILGFSHSQIPTGSSYTTGSSSSTHYGGVDDSPYTIAKNDPDWYYDHYEYGDNDEIDEYLESQGYD